MVEVMFKRRFGGIGSAFRHRGIDGELLISKMKTAKE
jgi:hypothetical protein